MALVVKQIKRLEHPTEPDTWFDIRLPLSAGDMAGLRSDGSQIGMSLDLMAAVIVAWSYDPPVTLERVEALDIDTFAFLTREVMASSNLRDEAEKKDSGSPSPAPTSPPNQENNASPVSLVTS